MSKIHYSELSNKVVILNIPKTKFQDIVEKRLGIKFREYIKTTPFYIRKRYDGIGFSSMGYYYKSGRLMYSDCVEYAFSAIDWDDDIELPKVDLQVGEVLFDSQLFIKKSNIKLF